VKFILNTAFLICVSLGMANAQKGDFFLTHYSHKSESIDHANFDIAQDNKGVICIANRIGILRFDGRNWDHIITPAAVFSLSFNEEDNVLYMGGLNGLGKLVRDESNNLVYQSLLDSAKHVDNIISVVVDGGYLYGLNGHAIFRYSISDGSFRKIPSKYSGELYNLFQLDGKVYVSTEKSGLQLVGDNDIEETAIKTFDRLSVEFISRHPQLNKYLIGLVDNTLKIYDGKFVTKLDIKDNDGYLQNSEIVDGIWINDTLSAIATLKGGVIFINHRTKSIEQIINYQSGLPDNEVFAFSKDSNGGIWVAHSAGFTRISPSLPFRSYNKYEGLEGNILSVINHNDSLYVGTSLGLFYLQKVKDYEEIAYVESRIIKTTQEPIEPPTPTKKNKGVFGFLKKRNEPVTNPKEVKSSFKTVYNSKVRQELKSVRYQFKRVDGITSKVFHFMNTENQLFCGGLDGLYKIRGLKAVAISKEAVHTFTIAKKSNKIIAATYADQIKTFNLSSETHEEIDLFGDFRDQVQHIFEDSEGRIWLCSTDEIYFVTIENNEIESTESYKINNPYYFNTFGAEKNGKHIFINESGIFSINPSNGLTTIESQNKSLKYLNGANGEVWVFGGEEWTQLAEAKISNTLNLLSVFKNINYISSDDDKSHWVVTENNDLYKLTKAEEELIQPYQLYLKRIKTADRTLLPQQNLKFDQDNNSLIFEFAQPEFSGILDIKYQYMLVGLNEEWSNWSGNYNIVNFPYLPDGSYTLKMRSKNILGVISEIDPIKFRIIPPYWKRPWFYAFEFSVMAVLLFISVKLKKLGFKYRLMSRLLALITLIIIIEFIQTIAENKLGDESSPVIDFLIQVSMAIIILPVESLIRKFIFKEKDVQILDFINLKEIKKVKP
jgi:ligand-binding sensor domain-containing protein